MTGYGRSIYESNKRRFIIEIKSVNHKYNDISIKMNKNINYLENTIRKKIKKNISRGKIDVHISLEELEIDKKININKNLAEKYISKTIYHTFDGDMIEKALKIQLSDIQSSHFFVTEKESQT